MRIEEIKIWKFNLLDMFIIFAVVVAILMFLNNKQSNAVTSTVSGETAEIKDSKFTYVVQIKELSETTGDMIKQGDKLFDKASGTEMGVIKEVKIVPTQSGLLMNNGQIVTRSMPGKIDIYLTVEAEGRAANGELVANNLIRILVGSFKALKTKYTMFSGTIVDAK